MWQRNNGRSNPQFWSQEKYTQFVLHLYNTAAVQPQPAVSVWTIAFPCLLFPSLAFYEKLGQCVEGTFLEYMMVYLNVWCHALYLLHK